MGYISIGLMVVVLGFLIGTDSDTPGTLARVEITGLALGAGGALLVLVGMVVHAVGERRGSFVSR